MERNLWILWVLVVCFAVPQLWAQKPRVWTREDILARTVNPSRDYQTEAWPAHKIIANVYYVGTRNLGSFLITSDQGHILVNTTFEETLPLLRDSVEDLGFRFEDIRIILGSHAHADHMSADALAKEWTGAEVMAMDDDVPLLEAMTPGDKPHPIDRVLRHGDRVSLGGTTLTALKTPGHTPGTTTWTFRVMENSGYYDVVVLGAAIATGRTQLAGNEGLQQQFKRSFKINRSLECDVPLGPHVPMYRMEEKFAMLEQGGANPFVDPVGCQEEMFLEEQGFYLRLLQQMMPQDSVSEP